MEKKLFKYNSSFQLESGKSLQGLEIVYHTSGKLTDNKDNVLWVCHALTANSDCEDWWNELIGSGKCFDPEKYFIVCANIIASCYGSSGPLSINPDTGNKYYSSFPQVTIRDMVQAHILLRKHLGIDKIKIGMGGSMGAYQLMEWELAEPGIFDRHVWMTTSPRESAWGIAVHTAQRLCIEADESWNTASDNAGAKGLKAARAIGMLTYRNYEAFRVNQTDDDFSKLDHYKASAYINYQGDKLVKRFNAYSYWLLTKNMDTHNIARNRGTVEEVLNSINTKTLLVGISSDLLCPVTEQKNMAAHMPKATYVEIDSPYGHDGFLVEGEKISDAINAFLKQ